MLTPDLNERRLAERRPHSDEPTPVQVVINIPDLTFTDMFALLAIGISLVVPGAALLWLDVPGWWFAAAIILTLIGTVVTFHGLVLATGATLMGAGALFAWLMFVAPFRVCAMLWRRLTRPRPRPRLLHEKDKYR